MNLHILKNVIIEIPLIQIGVLILLCSLAAIFGKLKFILIFVYGFMLYWVFFLNEYKFGFSNESQVLHTGLFVFTSIVFVGCSAWMFFCR